MLSVRVWTLQLSGEVAQCKPISNMVDSMEIVACSFIIDSVVKLQFNIQPETQPPLF